MKTGDFVMVKDLMGFNASMQNLVGHIGVITGTCESFYLAGRWNVLISGKCYTLWQSDLELVDESR